MTTYYAIETDTYYGKDGKESCAALKTKSFDTIDAAIDYLKERITDYPGIEKNEYIKTRGNLHIGQGVTQEFHFYTPEKPESHGRLMSIHNYRVSSTKPF